MPIPDLTPDGWLPPGVHRCTLDEIERAFANANAPEQRARVMRALRMFCEDPTVQQYAEHIVVDGSFTSKKPEPDDADVVVGLTRGTVRAILADPFMSSKVVLGRLEGANSPRYNGQHLIHGFADDIGGPKYNHFRSYFQTSDRDDEPPRKGVLLVSLNRNLPAAP